MQPATADAVRTRTARTLFYGGEWVGGCGRRTRAEAERPVWYVQGQGHSVHSAHASASAVARQRERATSGVRRRGAGMEREEGVNYEQQPGEVELVGWLTFTAPSLLGAPPAAADASACESMRRVLMSL